MRRLKSFLSILIVAAMLAGFMVVPVSAANSFVYEDEAEMLYKLGLLKGIGDSVCTILELIWKGKEQFLF